MSRDRIHRVLSQLAQFKKLLFSYPRGSCGSHTSYVDGWGETCYMIDRQYNSWTIVPDAYRFMKNRYNFGPYETSLHYYSSLLHNGWTEWIKEEWNGDEPEGITDGYKIHAFLTSTLLTYVKRNSNDFFLAHPDLHESNIFVDKEGNIVGIIDWEHSSTLPKQASEHYPIFLFNETEFIKRTKEVFVDPLAELQHWQNFYAKQFEDDPELGEYFLNIKLIMAFEILLRMPGTRTIDNLVNGFKLVESAEALDRIGLPFPWKAPVSPRTKNEEASDAKAVGHDVSIVETYGIEVIPTVKSVSEDEALAEGQVDELRSLNSFAGGENGRRF